MRAKFSEMTYEGGPAKCCHAGKGGHGESVWMTAEQIPVKGSYTEKDLEGLEHLNYAAGIAPFLRGIAARTRSAGHHPLHQRKEQRTRNPQGIR